MHVDDNALPIPWHVSGVVTCVTWRGTTAPLSVAVMETRIVMPWVMPGTTCEKEPVHAYDGVSPTTWQVMLVASPRAASSGRYVPGSNLVSCAATYADRSPGARAGESLADGLQPASIANAPITTPARERYRLERLT
jgi:hypothetical protein